MNCLSQKINKDLNNIIRSYLIISQNNVKRSYNLIIYNLQYNLHYNKKFNDFDIIFGFCSLCDDTTEILNKTTYNPYYVPYYIMRYYFPCISCYKYLKQITKCMTELMKNI